MNENSEPLGDPDAAATPLTHPATAALRNADAAPTPYRHETIRASTESSQPTGLPLPPPQKTEMPWPTIPGYLILGELGRGGMGVVFKAMQTGARRVVALKMIRGRGVPSVEAKVRFQIEAEAVARLQHTNIVPLHEVGEVEGQPFFSLEYCEGGSLDKRLKERRASGDPPTPRETAALIEKLARAMHYAHLHGVVHRDLKPGNVLLAADDEPKVTDFGLAKQMDTDQQHSQTGEVKGTPAYMAPEQAAGRVREVGPAVDVYALGVMLYELLTGRLPFTGEHFHELLSQILTDEPAAPSSHGVVVPRDLETICLKCLHKEPGRRYASAGELADDLGRFLADEPIRARPVSRTEKAVKWVRRNPAVAGLLSAFLVALIGGTVTATAFALRSERNAEKAVHEAEEKERQRKVAVAQKEEADTQKENAREETRRTKSMLMTAQLLRVAAIFERDPDLGRRLLHDEAACPPELRDFSWGLYNRWCQRERADVKGHAGLVHAVAYSPDGKTLASGSGDHTVKLWNARTGQEIATLRGHRDRVVSVAFSPDGEVLASGSLDRTVKLWDVQTGKVRVTFEGHTNYVKCVAFSPDGKTVASGDDDMGTGKFRDRCEIKLWDVQTGKARVTLEANAVMSVAFSPDGKTLASGHGNLGELKLWDAVNGQELLSLKGRRTGVMSVTFNPDGKTLASGSTDRTAKLWDAQTGVPRPTLWGYLQAVGSVAFAPDGKTMASGNVDGTVSLWDVQSGQERTRLTGHVGLVHSLAFSPDGRTLASGGGLTDWGSPKPGQIKLWETRTGEERVSLAGHTAYVTSLAISPDGKTLVSGSGDRTTRLWNVRTAVETASYPKQDGYVTSVAISPDGGTIASAYGSIELRDALTGKERLTLTGHTDCVYTVAYSPDGKLLASGGADGTVRLWDVASGRVRATLDAEAGDVQSVAFSADGTTLAVGNFGGVIKLWDIESGRLLRTLKGHTSSVKCVAFSPDGKTLASASLDRTVKLWPLRGPAEPVTLKGHNSPVYSVAFSPDGISLASGGGYGVTEFGTVKSEVKLFDVATGQERASLKGHSETVVAVAFSPDGKTLASGSNDRTIKLWQSDRAR